MQRAYQADLAYIHDTGFGHLAVSAATVIIEALKSAEHHSGTVVDLGCGSGMTARELRNAGFEVVGIDLSESLIALARERLPDVEFHVDSFVTAKIPPCIAVTAIGEVFNYTFDPENNRATLANTLERIYAALAPGGLLLFDLAGPDRAPSNNPQRTFIEKYDWAVMVETEADETRSVLTRRITTFRKQGELYRRDFELHHLQLVEPDEIVELLQHTGFSVQTLDSYGSLLLPQGLVGFLASKPDQVDA
jgi:SAM-dependent methyltransferase